VAFSGLRAVHKSLALFQPSSGRRGVISVTSGKAYILRVRRPLAKACCCEAWLMDAEESSLGQRQEARLA